MRPSNRVPRAPPTQLLASVLTRMSIRRVASTHPLAPSDALPAAHAVGSGALEVKLYARAQSATLSPTSGGTTAQLLSYTVVQMPRRTYHTARNTRYGTRTALARIGPPTHNDLDFPRFCSDEAHTSFHGSSIVVGWMYEETLGGPYVFTPITLTLKLKSSCGSLCGTGIAARRPRSRDVEIRVIWKSECSFVELAGSPQPRPNLDSF